MMERLADETLVSRIPHAPEEEANRCWAELCRRHELLLCSIAQRARLDEPDDLITDLYQHLKGADRRWTRLASFRAEPNVPFRNWLAVVASRLARRRPSLRRPEETQMPEEHRAVDARVESVPTRVALLGCLARLRHVECRVLLRRHYWNGETFEELAMPLGRTAAALRQMHRRNLRELAKLMEEEHA
jgi:RNA polymerase sigma factor (sigma-70 family)